MVSEWREGHPGLCHWNTMKSSPDARLLLLTLPCDTPEGSTVVLVWQLLLLLCHVTGWQAAAATDAGMTHITMS